MPGIDPSSMLNAVETTNLATSGGRQAGPDQTAVALDHRFDRDRQFGVSGNEVCDGAVVGLFGRWS